MFGKQKKQNKKQSDFIYSLSLYDLKNNSNIFRIITYSLTEIKKIISINTYNDLNQLVVYNSVLNGTETIIVPNYLNKDEISKYIIALIDLGNTTDISSLKKLLKISDKDVELIFINIDRSAQLMSFISEIKMKEALDYLNKI